MYLVTADEMRRMDQATIESFGIPGRVLMENAGRGATAFFLKSVYRHHPGAVGVAAGRGNNGGDGFVMARYLHQKGVPVTVFLHAARERVTGDALANLTLLDRMGVTVHELPDQAAFDERIADMQQQRTWIDALLGTGLQSDVRGYFRQVIDALNRQARPVFAVDIASGVNADTGQVCGGCVEAAATATFGFAKLGHLVYPGRQFSGDLEIVEIGIPPHVAAAVGCRQQLILPGTIEKALPERDASDHKGKSGHLLVLAGSPGKTGAAAMTTMAALRTGAGLATLGVPRSLNPVLETMLTEAMTVGLPETDQGTIDESAFKTVAGLLDGRRCLALGPGLGTAPATGRLVRRLIEACPVPLVIDADGLNLIAADTDVLMRRRAPVVLTPHPGEMARLSGDATADIQRDRVGHARAFAQRHQVHLVLKGAATVVAGPDGTVFVNPTGNAGMAAGGMGDVLTGIIAGLITQGIPAELAARAGVYLHGAAADRLAATKGPVGYLASEVLNALPETARDVRETAGGRTRPRCHPLCYATGESAR